MSAPAGRILRPKTLAAVPRAGDKVKEIIFDLLWHSYNYLDPGEDGGGGGGGGGTFSLAWLLPSNISRERCESHITTCGGGTLLEIPKSNWKYIPTALFDFNNYH